jgi:hypothetical protein
MYALYVCLTCMPYMYAVYACGNIKPAAPPRLRHALAAPPARLHARGHRQGVGDACGRISKECGGARCEC